MKVIVKAKKSWCAFDRDVVKAAVLYAKDFYKIEEFVHVRLVGLHDTANGFMAETNQGKYVIWISPHITIRTLLETVFHEMTHVNQAIEGWYLTEEDTAYWHGKERPYNEETDYWNAPWEREARLMGKKLRKRYLKDYI